MSFALIISPKAQKFLDRLLEKEFQLISNELLELSSDPYLGKLLVGQLRGFWSWRVSKFRIIYEIQDERMIVHIIKIGLRKKVYR